jgi:hypothetical protein
VIRPAGDKGGRRPGEIESMLADHALRQPEWAILLELARAGSLPRAVAAGGEQRGIDWARFVELATRHKMLPLAFARLKASSSPPPRAELLELWRRAEAVSSRSRQLSEELVRLSRLLDAGRVDHVPFKGPVLSIEAYGTVDGREYADLDILVPSGQIAAAKRILCDNGYEVEYALPPAIEAAMLDSRAHYHLGLINYKLLLRVELHWKSDPEYPVERLDDPQWWSQLEAMPIGSTTVRTLPASENLLILILHGSKHHWEWIGSLAELGALAERAGEREWVGIIARARAISASIRLAVGMHLLEAIAGVAYRGEASQWLQGQERARRIATGLASRWLEPGASPPSSIERLRLDAAMLETVRQRARLVGAVLFRPSLVEWTQWPLPRLLFPLYPLLRTARLLAKHVGFSRTV